MDTIKEKNKRSNDNSNLFKIKDGTYVSKNDPQFFRKYLEAFPSVKNVFDQNYIGYQNEELSEKAVVAVSYKNKIPKRAFIFVLFIFSLFLIGNDASSNENNIKLPNHDLTIIKNDSNIKENKSVIVTESKISKDDLLKISVINNALERFKEKNGKYPLSLDQLTDKIPDNWLSFIPLDNLTYLPVNNTYKLIYKDQEINCTCTVDKLELYFYVDTNQLAVMKDGTVLATYPVASGKSGKEMPYTESKVTERIAYPNGGKGVFGTRGIVLDKNYAIHGTNEEELIGKKVSHGCIRMLNKDIDELYPYISIGTPFKVVKGKPQEPLYKNGLPHLKGEINKNKETITNKTFHWNN